MPADWKPTPADTPFLRIGGEPVVRAVTGHFYDAMESSEPALAALHARDESGRITAEVRDRFALFFIGWLGGPQDYMALHGHPRLRMRHAHVAVDIGMRDAWMRCMVRALEEANVPDDVRGFLIERLAGVADFLRNVDER